MIELRHLRYFLELSRQQHLTRAADALNITQSTLSHQLRQLEEALGMALFDRVGRGLSLNEAGRTFVAYATRSVLEVEEGKVAIEELHALTRGRLRIGVIQTYNATLLPPVIAQFASEFPGVHVVVEDLTATQIEQDVANGDLNLGVAFARATREDVTAEPLFSERLVLVVGKNHPAAGLKEVEASLLAGMELAVQTPRFSSRQRIDQALGKWIHKQVRLEMSSIDAMLKTVAASALGAVVFERAIPETTNLVSVPIANPQVQRTAALVWNGRRTRSAAAVRFADAVRAHLLKVR
ncbi:LysR substrate-binding domain-containing protein [Variovorax sp. ZT4R33]